MSTSVHPATEREGILPGQSRLTGRWRSETFSALRHRNYRLYFFGQLISLTGSWLQSAALTWLAYAMTGQSSWAAVVSAAQVLPTFLLGAWGGSLADRWPKRRLIFGCQFALLILALLLAGLVAAGAATPWALLAVATACGFVNAVDLPARLAFVIDMVGRDDLVNAIALNSMLFNTARVVGPALSGVVLRQWGAAWCFFFNSLSFVAVLAALAAMHRLPTDGQTHATQPHGSLPGGFAYLRQRPRLVLLLILAGAMAFFGWPMLSLLPAVSDKQLGQGPDGYFALLIAVGMGALLGALVLASTGSRVRRGVLLVLGVVVAATGIVGLSQVHALAAALLCATLGGMGLILFFATSQAMLQLSSADHNRGRVMGIWSMVLCGAHPLGHLVTGPAADHWGVPSVLLTMGIGIAVAGLLVGSARLLVDC
jgi:MFS family permease